jgi:putative oxidoreductase
METPFAHLVWALTRAVFGFGLAFLHGYPKVLGGRVIGLAKTVADLGFPAPQFFAWCASLSEFAGGILVAVGLATRGAASFAAATMAVALFSERHNPLSHMELSALYLAVMLLAIAQGGGRYSLDSWMRLRSPLSRR